MRPDALVIVKLFVKFLKVNFIPSTEIYPCLIAVPSCRFKLLFNCISSLILIVCVIMNVSNYFTCMCSWWGKFEERGVRACVGTMWGQCGPMWGQCVVSVSTVCSRCRTSVGPVWGQCRASVGPMWRQYGASVWPIWGQCGHNVEIFRPFSFANSVPTSR